MSIKIILQFSLASILLILSTGVALYEGSEIVLKPWEWKYSAIFSQLSNGQVQNANDILLVDHFVYAAKFAPTFPILMLLSGTYIIALIGFVLFKRNDKVFSYFLSCIGLIFLSLSVLVSNSPTTGLSILFISFLILGILAIVIALLGFRSGSNQLTSN